MRIISQLGMDFPYNQIIVFVDDNCVQCKSVSDISEISYLLGRYETEERAREVFNEIHDNYVRLDTESIVFAMPEV